MRLFRRRQSQTGRIEDDEIALCRVKGEGGDSRANVGSQTSGVTSETDENDKEPPSIGGLKLVLLTIGLCLAVFILTIDNTILATALPRITAEFNSLNDVGWYGSSYLLTTTALQPSFGKVFTCSSVKWVWLASLFVFEVGSAICATAVNSAMFIVGRAVAGIGAAGLFSGAIAIIGLSVSLRKRPIYLGILSSMSAVAAVVGPIIGGLLTDRLSWRWCFWINPIFGAAAAASIVLFYSEPRRSNSSKTVKDRLKELDLAGVAILMPAVICLVLALQWGGSKYKWQDFQVWGCLVISAFLFVSFGVVQVIMQDRATMPPRIICNRTVATGAVLSALLSMAMYVHIFYLPFYFQAVKGVSAETSGVRFLPYLISMTCGALVSGGLITSFGPYNPSLWIGIVMFAAGSSLLCTLSVNSSVGQWLGYQVLIGVGAGTYAQVPLIAMQTALDDKDIPVGNAIMIFSTTLGGAIGVPVAENIFTYALSSLHQPTGLRLQAYNYALTTTYMVPVICSGLALSVSLAMPWKSVKSKKQ